MNKKEDFLIGMTVGGIILLLFYILLFFPILCLYILTPTEYREVLKYFLGIVFIFMLFNSAKSAYESFKVIKNSEKINKIINNDSKKVMIEDSLFLKGLKYRIELEFSFLNKKS